MPPHKSKRTPVPETSRVLDSIRFYSANMEKYFLESQGRLLIQELGFEPLMTHCKEIRTLVCYHQWEHFCITPTSNANIFVVHEFYASLTDQMNK